MNFLTNALCQFASIRYSFGTSQFAANFAMASHVSLSSLPNQTLVSFAQVGLFQKCLVRVVGLGVDLGLVARDLLLLLLLLLLLVGVGVGGVGVGSADTDLLLPSLLSLLRLLLLLLLDLGRVFGLDFDLGLVAGDLLLPMLLPLLLLLLLLGFEVPLGFAGPSRFRILWSFWSFLLFLFLRFLFLLQRLQMTYISFSGSFADTEHP